MLRPVGVRSAVLISVWAVSAVISALVAFHPGLRFAFGQPELQATLETAASLIALLGGFLAFGRLRRLGRLTDLTLACALGVIALSNLGFVLVPALTGDAASNFAAWLAIISRSLGSLFFGITAFLPDRQLRRIGRAQLTVMACVGASLVLTVLVDWALYRYLPTAITAYFPARAPAAPVVHTDPGLRALQIATAAVDVAAAAGYLGRSQRPDGALFGWLSAAAVFAAASHLNYFLYPSQYARVVSVGDTFRLCFFIVLLAGSMREIWSYWQALSQVMVTRERRRIARDLHDGLAQELAYLTRNLDELSGSADEEALDRLRRAAGRARMASRLAVSNLAVTHQLTLADAFAGSVSVVAERVGVDLDLDLRPGARLPATHLVALVRIASEAVTNTARHSGCRRVSLSVERWGARTRMRVSDAGSGFDLAVPAGGFGLTSMREHATLVGGDLRICSVPGQGTLVEATL